MLHTEPTRKRSHRTPSEATMKIKVSQKAQRPQKFFKEHHERVNEVKAQKAQKGF